jgi:uncharacterized cupredoxin-like copper-binding protein
MTTFPATTPTRPAAAEAPARREPLSGLNRLTAGTLAAAAVGTVYVQAVIIEGLRPDLATFAMIYLIAAGLVAGIPIGRWRWTPLLATLLGTLTVVGNGQVILYELTHPGAPHVFGYFVVAAVLTLVAIAGGILATVQNYRFAPAERRTPRWLGPSLIALAAMSVGAMLVGALPRAAGLSVSPDALAELPAVVTHELHFEMPDLTARVGETVALRLDNQSNIPHTFTVDELGVNVEMPANSTGLALFRADAAGTYTLYCDVPGHRAAGMEATLVVTP